MLLNKYLFARESQIAHIIAGKIERPKVFVQVQAPTKDSAILLLVGTYPHINKKDWDFLELLDPDSDLGALGAEIKWELYT